MTAASFFVEEPFWGWLTFFWRGAGRPFYRHIAKK